MKSNFTIRPTRLTYFTTKRPTPPTAPLYSSNLHIILISQQHIENTIQKEARYKLEVLGNNSFYVLERDSYYMLVEPVDGAVIPSLPVPLAQQDHGFG
jgi:hypothetical protein